jgi:hypothetical protein
VDQIDGLLADLSTCPYGALELGQRVAALQGVVDAMDRGDQYSHLGGWVARLDGRVEAVLVARLAAAARGWTAEFEKDAGGSGDKPRAGLAALSPAKRGGVSGAAQALAAEQSGDAAGKSGAPGRRQRRASVGGRPSSNPPLHPCPPLCIAMTGCMLRAFAEGRLRGPISFLFFFFLRARTWTPLCLARTKSVGGRC